jgi:hypothetical protein
LLWQPLSNEEKRENNSARSLLLHVFTQPGSKAALTAPKPNFRFDPETGLNSDIASGPKSANTGSEKPYSITSSALARRVAGISRPSDLARFVGTK